MERKSGGYRAPDLATRVCSVVPSHRHKEWFSQIWNNLTGASTRVHPAPFPLELATRLVRMFSFVGDIVVDPFWGTGTVSVAAALSGRNSIGFDIDPQYVEIGAQRFVKDVGMLAKLISR